MAKRRFLVRGGKGRIGIGGQQLTENDIIPIYEDNSEKIYEIQNNYFNLQQQADDAKRFALYNSFVYTDQLPDDFSGTSTFFNPNQYLLSKNSKGEFFFGIDRNKPDARLDIKGVFAQVIGTDRYRRSYGRFYCLKGEEPAFENGSIVFYKIEGQNLFLENLKRYNFSIAREDVVNYKATNSHQYNTLSIDDPVTSDNPEDGTVYFCVGGADYDINLNNIQIGIGDEVRTIYFINGTEQKITFTGFAFKNNIPEGKLSSMSKKNAIVEVKILQRMSGGDIYLSGDLDHNPSVSSGLEVTERSFSPVLNGTSANYSFNSVKANYYKIGKLVTIHIIINQIIQDVFSATNKVSLGNIPSEIRPTAATVSVDLNVIRESDKKPWELLGIIDPNGRLAFVDRTTGSSANLNFSTSVQGALNISGTYFVD